MNLCGEGSLENEYFKFSFVINVQSWSNICCMWCFSEPDWDFSSFAIPNKVNLVQSDCLLLTHWKCLKLVNCLIIIFIGFYLMKKTIIKIQQIKTKTAGLESHNIIFFFWIRYNFEQIYKFHFLKWYTCYNTYMYAKLCNYIVPGLLHWSQGHLTCNTNQLSVEAQK